MDLEMFFTLGSSSTTSAQNIFTNRTAEFAVFDESLAQQNLENPVELVQDLRSPRRNVLVFYGVGGVGKTRLSKELESRFLAGSDQSTERATLRMDFEDGGSADVEGLLLGLRASLGEVSAVWPAFDLAFAAYWEKAHPGIPLQTAVSRSSVVRRVAKQLDVGAQLQDAIEGLLNSPGGVLGIFTASARIIGKSIQENLAERRVMRECPFFQPVTQEPDPLKVRSYLGALLAWDLARHQQSHARRGRRFEFTVFLDTWERVQDDTRYRGNTEDLVARLVYLMPNALFVVTGRNQLRWADEENRAFMQWAGPEHWPYLAEGVTEVEPRQHLVGGLSTEDADRFLRRRIVHEGEPAIPDNIRQVIVEAADGLPLYLDLAAVRFAQLTAAGTPLRTTDFGHPFPEIVLRLMRDLEPDQRTLLRMASLVSRFDEDLLLAGAPNLSDSALSRFVRRSLVQVHPTDYLPYGIHESLREAVQMSDLANDRWSEREWRGAAERILDGVRRRVEPELGASGSIDGALLIGLFTDAYTLAVRTQHSPPWLWQLAGRLHSLGAWNTLEWTGAITPPDSPLRPAAAALTAIGRRRARGPNETASELRASLADTYLDPIGRQYASYWLGWMLDEIDEWAEAERVRLGVANSNGPFAAYVRHALARSDWVCGRLRRAISWEFDDADPLQRFWRTGIHGRVAWILGRFDEADELCTERLHTAETIGSPELVAHALRTRGEVRSFTIADAADSIEAAAIYSRIQSGVSEAEAEVSIAISSAGSAPLDSTLRLLDDARLRLGASWVGVDAGEVFARCVHGDLGGAKQARQRMLANTRGNAYGFWLTISDWWISESAEDWPVQSTQVDWLNGEDEARRRWVTVMNDARSARGV